jgi:hypothetical protein
MDTLYNVLNWTQWQNVQFAVHLITIWSGFEWAWTGTRSIQVMCT